MPKEVVSMQVLVFAFGPRVLVTFADKTREFMDAADELEAYTKLTLRKPNQEEKKNDHQD